MKHSCLGMGIPYGMSYLSLGSRLRLQNVVLATDFSEASNAAIGYAATVARHYQGKVFAVHVIVPEIYIFEPREAVPKIQEGLEQWAELQMKDLMASEELRDVPHEGIIKNGEVWDGLQEVITSHNVDMIVTGTRGRRGLRKLIMGSVAEEVVRLSPVPVLTVHPECRHANHELRAILYPTDFSADSIRALAYALSIAQEFQACIIFVHVAPSAHHDPEVRNRLHAFFADQLQQIIPAETQSGCQQQFAVEFGDPSQAILECAKVYKADLIVMGIRGAGSLVRAATHFGSTAYRVISQAQTPVLSVRSLLKQDMFR